MKRTDEQMKEEALYIMDSLIKRRGLNPNVKKYFAEGKLYYSYLTALGFIGSVDSIDYDDRYSKLVADFQAKHDCLVYHAIETGDMLSLLYVTRNTRNRPKGKSVWVYVHNFKHPKCSEWGTIWIDSLHGALYRTDVSAA